MYRIVYNCLLFAWWVQGQIILRVHHTSQVLILLLLLRLPCRTPLHCTAPYALSQARVRQQEAGERLSLLEEQLSVKEKAIALMETDLEKVKNRKYKSTPTPSTH